MDAGCSVSSISPSRPFFAAPRSARANFNFRLVAARDNRSPLEVSARVRRLECLRSLYLSTVLTPLGKKRRRYCRWQPVGRRYELYRAAGIFIGKRARQPAREKTCLAGNDVDIAARIHGFRFRRVTTPPFSLSFSTFHSGVSTCPVILTMLLPSVQFPLSRSSGLFSTKRTAQSRIVRNENCLVSMSVRISLKSYISFRIF